SRPGARTRSDCGRCGWGARRRRGDAAARRIPCPCTRSRPREISSPTPGGRRQDGHRPSVVARVRAPGARSNYEDKDMFATKITRLDVRPIDAKDRFELITSTYHSLPRGGTLDLVLDHDPKC